MGVNQCGDFEFDKIRKLEYFKFREKRWSAIVRRTSTKQLTALFWRDISFFRYDRYPKRHSIQQLGVNESVIDF